MVAMAGVQYRLLSIGGLRTPVGTLFGVTLASSHHRLASGRNRLLAMSICFVGIAVSGLMMDCRAGLSSAGIVASGLSLALVAAAGLALAADQGAHLDLIPAVVGVLISAHSWPMSLWWSGH